MSERGVICTVSGPCVHAATGLELRPGHMSVSHEQAETLIAAGLAEAAPDDAAETPREE